MCKECKHPLFGRNLVAFFVSCSGNFKETTTLNVRKLHFTQTCENILFLYFALMCNFATPFLSSEYKMCCSLSYLLVYSSHIRTFQKMPVFLCGTKRCLTTFKKGREYEYSSRIQIIFNSTDAAL
jgi:hypothetical protein